VEEALIDLTQLLAVAAEAVRGVQTMSANQSRIPAERIEWSTLLVRGQKVLLDRGLAKL
jgi:hypothetical protein